MHPYEIFEFGAGVDKVVDRDTRSDEEKRKNKGKGDDDLIAHGVCAKRDHNLKRDRVRYLTCFGNDMIQGGFRLPLTYP